MTIEEKQLVTLLQQPESKAKAFATLLHTYQKPLYHLVRQIVLLHDDTEDVLQNVWIKVLHGIENFKGESKLYSWLYRIATNEAITYLHQKRKKSGVDFDEFSEKQISKLTSDSYFDGDEITVKLHQAIAKLPEKQQLVFKLKYFEELKYEEIAEITGTSVGALKASYHLAVKKIEEFVQNH